MDTLRHYNEFHSHSWFVRNCKSWGLRAEKIMHMVKSILLTHEDLLLNPQHLCERLSTVANTCNPELGDRRSTGQLSKPECWATGLVKSRSQEMKWTLLSFHINCWHTHIHICVCMTPRYTQAREHMCTHTHNIDWLRLIKFAAVHVKKLGWLGHAVKAGDLQIQVVALPWKVSRKIYKKQRSKLERKDLGGVVLYFPFSFYCLSWINKT